MATAASGRYEHRPTRDMGGSTATPLTSGRLHQRRAHACCGRTPSTLAAAASTTATAHLSGRAVTRYAYSFRSFNPAPDLCARRRVTRPFFAPIAPPRSVMSAELGALVQDPYVPRKRTLHRVAPRPTTPCSGWSRRRRSGSLSAPGFFEIERGLFLVEVYRRASRAAIGHRISRPKSRCGPRSSWSRWP